MHLRHLGCIQCRVFIEFWIVYPMALEHYEVMNRLTSRRPVIRQASLFCQFGIRTAKVTFLVCVGYKGQPAPNHVYSPQSHHSRSDHVSEMHFSTLAVIFALTVSLPASVSSCSNLNQQCTYTTDCCGNFFTCRQVRWIVCFIRHQGSPFVILIGNLSVLKSSCSQSY